MSDKKIVNFDEYEWNYGDEKFDYDGVDFCFKFDGDLTGATLTGACEGVLFKGADLTGATIEVEELTESLFEGCNLTGATLKATSRGVDSVVLMDCNLRGATIKNTCLDEVCLRDCDLRDATFEDCVFGEDAAVLLQGCKLSGAIFKDCNLSSDFVLHETSLEGVTFEGCSFSEGFMENTEATFVGCDEDLD